MHQYITHLVGFKLMKTPLNLEKYLNSVELVLYLQNEGTG